MDTGHVNAIMPVGDLPLSFNQEAQLYGEWWARMTATPTAPQHTLLGLRLRGPLNVLRLDDAMNTLVRRHGVFASSFCELDPTDGVHGNALSRKTLYRQVRRAVAPFTVSHRSLEDSRGGAAGEEAQRIAAEEFCRPFDYERPPLMRATAVRCGPLEHLLIVVVHHLISDGWSLQLLRKELEALYKGSPPLPALSGGYSDFAHWQRGHLQGPVLDRLLQHWKSHWRTWEAAVFDVRQLPFARATPAARDFSADFERVTLDSALTRELRAFARRRSLTLYMLLLAVVMTVLHLCSGKARLALWGNFANRLRSDVEGLVGWFANSHILGADFAGDPAGLVLLEQVRDAVLTAYAHQEIPMPVVLYALLEDLRARARSHRALDSVHVSFDFRRSLESRCEALEVTPVPLRRKRLGRDLNIAVLERNTEIEILANYATERFVRSNVRCLLHNIRRVLQTLIATPEIRVSRLRDLIDSGSC